MKVCGVDIKGNDAVICILSIDDEIFNLPDCRVRKVSIEKSANRDQLRLFQQTFSKLMQDYKIEKVVIRERPTKGKFAGGVIGFKLEAAIQLIENLAVELMTPLAIKESLKKNPLPISFDETGLKVFQETAFVTAYAYLMHAKYGDQPE